MGGCLRDAPVGPRRARLPPWGGGGLSPAPGVHQKRPDQAGRRGDGLCSLPLGFSLGIWLEELRDHLRPAGVDTGLLFRHTDGTRWDSHYFRHNHLYPLLTLQRLAGDSFLKAFDGSPGNTIPDKFYSMHSYRNGGRSSVSKRRPGCVRAATPVEVTEHGRWRQRHSGTRTPPPPLPTAHPRGPPVHHPPLHVRRGARPQGGGGSFFCLPSIGLVLSAARLS